MIESFLLAAGLAALLAWLWLALAHGRYWEARISPRAPEPDSWPEVTAIIPARNEAATIADVVRGVLGQDYPGKLRLIVVDDQSGDGTGEVAQNEANSLNSGERIIILRTEHPPQGWSGKVRAMQCGWECALAEGGRPALVWFTDADIAHGPQVLRGLVAQQMQGGWAMVSTMVKLRCECFWERALVPAFVYFFKLLYPFRRVANPQSRTAGAAGGCMLVQGGALEKIGGPAAIRGALIDDCALAAALKGAGGAICLDLTEESWSLRGYPRLADGWNTVARTAYTQLGYSPLRLVGCVLGLGWLFLLPPLAALGGEGLLRLAGAGAWAVMAGTFWPMVRFYRLNVLWALLLPVITVIYLGATLDSARCYYAGQGGRWKERVYS